MKRPVRPVALVVLTACALYPGLTSVFQGLYPWVNGQEFALLSQQGAFVDLSLKLGLPIWAPNLFKAAVGGAYLAGVPGLFSPGRWLTPPGGGRLARVAAGDAGGARVAAARARAGRDGDHRRHLPHRVPRDGSAPARMSEDTRPA